MGDSITDAWVRPQFGGFFPANLILTVASADKQLRKCSFAFVPTSSLSSPKVVVILAGTNDIAGNTGPMSLEEIEANLTSMSELAASTPSSSPRLRPSCLRRAATTTKAKKLS